MHGPPRRSPHIGQAITRWLPIGVITTFFFIAGCQSAMSTQAASASMHASGNTLPLRFKRHNFDAYCYNTLDCQVVYDGTNHTRTSTGQRSGPPPSADYKERTWGGASYLDVKNFPAPAQLKWTSLDGQTHEDSIDLSKIFADERVLHSVPDAQIPDHSFEGPAGEPNIFIEVNDRTVSVYMKMLIPTKEPQIPGNANSYFRDDLIKAWSKTY